MPDEPFRSRPACAINLSGEGMLVERNAVPVTILDMRWPQKGRGRRSKWESDQDQFLSAPREYQRSVGSHQVFSRLSFMLRLGFWVRLFCSWLGLVLGFNGSGLVALLVTCAAGDRFSRDGHVRSLCSRPVDDRDPKK